MITADGLEFVSVTATSEAAADSSSTRACHWVPENKPSVPGVNRSPRVSVVLAVPRDEVARAKNGPQACRIPSSCATCSELGEVFRGTTRTNAKLKLFGATTEFGTRGPLAWMI